MTKLEVVFDDNNNIDHVRFAGQKYMPKKNEDKKASCMLTVTAFQDAGADNGELEVNMKNFETADG